MKQSIRQSAVMAIIMLCFAGSASGMRSFGRRSTALTVTKHAQVARRMGASATLSTEQGTLLLTSPTKPSLLGRARARAWASLARTVPVAKFLGKSAIFVGTTAGTAYAGSYYGQWTAAEEHAAKIADIKNEQNRQAQKMAAQQQETVQKLRTANAENARYRQIEERKRHIVQFLSEQNLARGVEAKEGELSYNADLILAAASRLNAASMGFNNTAELTQVLSQTYQEDQRILAACLQPGIEKILPEVKATVERIVVENFSELVKTDSGKGVILTYLRSFGAELKEQELSEADMSRLDLLVLNHFDALAEVQYKQTGLWSTQVANKPEIGHEILRVYFVNRKSSAVAKAVARSATHETIRPLLRTTVHGQEFLKESAAIV